MRQPVTWYMSLRSPYSWLAMHLAERQWPDLWAAATLRVFFQPGVVMTHEMRRRDIEFPYVPMSRAKHFYILRDVRRIALSLGLTPTWPVDRDPQWEVPSLALIAALRQEPEAGRAFAVELTAARWERNENIMDRAVIGRCAARCGLEPSVADAIDHPVVRQWGIETLQEVQAQGIFGVPMVTIGREPYWGIDRLPEAARVWRSSADAEEMASASARPGCDRAMTATAALEADHAGGCG